VHKYCDTPQTRRLLRARHKRPRCGSATQECDEFPSPHGLAHAKDYIGIKRISHFWIENCAVRHAQARNRPQPLLEVMANFCQQLARAKRFRHIIITSRRPCFILFLAERIGGDRDDRNRSQRRITFDQAARVAAVSI
jgi:hypothetical protein